MSLNKCCMFLKWNRMHWFFSLLIRIPIFTLLALRGAKRESLISSVVCDQLSRRMPLDWVNLFEKKGLTLAKALRSQRRDVNDIGRIKVTHILDFRFAILDGKNRADSTATKAELSRRPSLKGNYIYLFSGLPPARCGLQHAVSTSFQLIRFLTIQPLP